MRHSNIAFFIPHIGCPNKCSFCNQNTISGKTLLPHAEDIIKTLSDVMENMPLEKLKESEIAFFGGSFTAIERAYMTELLEAASEFVGVGKISGIRVSTRPDAISDEVLSILKKYKVTAIELGAQSMCNDVLLKNMRGHTADDVAKASNLIKDYGFSLGLQMMTGLYGDADEGAIYTAQSIIDLSPDTVRIYPTVVLKDTYLGKLFESGNYNPPSLNETVALCAKLLDMFEKKGIRVIRVGLHDEPGVKENFLAGAYHPALGELILSERFFQKALNLFKANNLQNGNIEICVNSSCISQILGQKKSNLERFSVLGYNVRVSTDNSLKIGDIKLR